MQQGSWGETTTGKQAGINESGDPLWASLIQNRVTDNTKGVLADLGGLRGPDWEPRPNLTFARHRHAGQLSDVSSDSNQVIYRSPPGAQVVQVV